MLATRLKELRETKNLSQAAFAKEFGISSGAIGNWESGKRIPDLATLQKIADFFDISIDYLTGTSQTTEEIKTARNTVKKLIGEQEDEALTIADFESKFDINYQTFRSWINGLTDYFDDKLSLLADYFGVTVDYLLGRSPSPTPQHSISLSFDEYDFDDYGAATPSPAVRIPVLGKVAAGIPIAAIEDIIDYEEIPAEMAKTGEFFGLKIEGQSMEPRVMDGDVVIVRKQEEIESGEIAIVMVDGNDATCKKFVKHESGVSLVSFNSAFPPQFYTREECEKLPVRIIGKVVELRGKF